VGSGGKIPWVPFPIRSELCPFYDSDAGTITRDLTAESSPIRIPIVRLATPVTLIAIIVVRKGSVLSKRE